MHSGWELDSGKEQEFIILYSILPQVSVKIFPSDFAWSRGSREFLSSMV